MFFIYGTKLADLREWAGKPTTSVVGVRQGCTA